MLYFIILGILVAGSSFGAYKLYAMDSDGLGTICSIIAFLIGIVYLVMIFVAIDANTGLEAKKAKIINTREAIEYKIKSGLYEDSFNVQDKNIINEIFNYNNVIIDGKLNQKNIWNGAFIPDIYDEFEIIDYNIVPQR